MIREQMVTAIITTYKRSADIVKRAAESVLNQTYKNIELIIVDDSPDSYEERENVKNMAQSLGENVRYVQHEVNQGACAARNTGLKYAKGEFVAFLDDDDEWLPEKTDKQLQKINEDDDIALVYCGRTTYKVSNQTETVQKIKFLNGYVFDKLIGDNFIGSTSFPLIRKNVIVKLGGFDIDMKAAQDFEAWLRISQKYKIDYVTDNLVRYYEHDGEQITKNFRNKADALKRIDEYYKDYFDTHKKQYAIRLYKLADVVRHFDKTEARQIFKTAFTTYPIPTLTQLRALKHIYLTAKS